MITRDYLDCSMAFLVSVVPEKEYRYFVMHELSPDETVSEHIHPSSREFIIIIRGSGILKVGDESKTFCADERVTVAEIPKGVKHLFMASTSTTYFVLRDKEDTTIPVD